MALSTQAQQLPTGTWRIHANYTQAKGLEIVQNQVGTTQIYCFSNNGFFCYDKNLNQAKTYSKVDGLSETQIAQIKYNAAYNFLMIAYQSGNIDIANLDKNGKIERIKNIDFIKKTTEIQGSKNINQIAFQANTAFLACDFGILVYDITKAEVKETYQNLGNNGISTAVKAIAFAKDSIYIQTNTGIRGAKFSPSVNLQYYGNWAVINRTDIFPKIIFPNDPLIVFPRAIMLDVAGKNWIADEQNGLLSNQTGSYKSYNPNGVLGFINKLYYFNNFIYAIGNNKFNIFNENTWQETPKIAISDDIIDTKGNRWQLIYKRIYVSNDAKNTQMYFNNGLPSSYANTLALDKEGLIWIGTDNGVAVLGSNTDVFAMNATAYTPYYQKRRLLIQENISKIVVDEANRKWIGTTNGVLLFNAAADNLIQKFTIDNSPLPSNQILDLAIDASSGEVFIITPMGLLSYQGDATLAANDFHDIKIFPNPVHPTYKGLLTINGLMGNSSIKIMDTAGRLVHQTQTNGGTATWNLLDAQQNDVNAGVYFIVAVSDDGSESAVGKVAVIR